MIGLTGVWVRLDYVSEIIDVDMTIFLAATTC